MILPVFITVISDHDKPQPPGCLLGDVRDVHINILEELNENPVSIRRVTSALDVAKVNQHSFSRKSGHL